MRRLLVLPTLLVAILLVFLLHGARTERGGGGGPRGEEEAAAHRDARPRADAVGNDDEPLHEIEFPEGSDERHMKGPMDGRLVYLDGAAAKGVQLHLAVGRPIEVRVFRNGEFTTKTVFLVVGHATTTTGDGGAFRFPEVWDAARARSFVYTADDPQAFVVAEVFGSGETVRARRCVKVTGRLVDKDGKPLDDYWFEGRAGTPEDWRTRVLFEEDSFVSAGGDLGVDSLAKDDTRTRKDGTFELVLAEGRNTLVFGEIRSEGSVEIEVTPSSTDVGELRVPGAPILAEEHALRGQVLTLAGAPHAGCDVLAWDGSVGLPTHGVTTDDAGAFEVKGLTSPNVILWAVPTDRRHVVLPVQTSATIRMPCVAPIILTAPTEEEYAWARVQAQGFYLFVRKDVFAAGEALDHMDVVGLPPGPLHIYLVTSRILEATLDLREPGEFLLAESRFRYTTWD